MTTHAQHQDRALPESPLHEPPPPAHLQGACVGGHVLLVLALEFLSEVVDHAVIEIFTTQVSITSSSLDFEDTIFNGEE